MLTMLWIGTEVVREDTVITIADDACAADDDDECQEDDTCSPDSATRLKMIRVVKIPTQVEMCCSPEYPFVVVLCKKIIPVVTADDALNNQIRLSGLCFFLTATDSSPPCSVNEHRTCSYKDLLSLVMIVVDSLTRDPFCSRSFCATSCGLPARISSRQYASISLTPSFDAEQVFSLKSALDSRSTASIDTRSDSSRLFMPERFGFYFMPVACWAEKSSPESSDSLDEMFGNCKDQISSKAVDPELKDVQKSTPESSDSLDELFGACKDDGSSAAFGVNLEFEELEVGSKVSENNRASLLKMKFSAQEVDFALDKLGEDAPVDDLVDFIVAAQVAQNSGVDINNQTHADDGKIEENTTKAMFWTMDVTLGLLEMGFSEDEISSAIEKFGAEIPIEELADSIFAHRMVDTCFEKDEAPALHWMNQSHGENYRNSRKSPKEQHNKHHSFNTHTAEAEASSSKAFRHAEDIHTSGIPKGKKPKLEYDEYSDAFLGTYSPETKPFELKSTGFSMSFPPKELHKVAKGSLDGVKNPQQPETKFSRGTLQMEASRPYIFYGNVLDVSHETWKKISQFLYAISPEFVNTQFFSALSRKEGYIHNLPTDNRSHIFPRSPATIEDAMPHTKEWWPSWDTRKQLSCINHESQGISQLCERLGKMLRDSHGVLSVEQQTEILHGCKRLNLMWVGQYKLNPIEPEQVEKILGYPVRHTQSIGSDRVERLKLLKHSFQVDTLGYHLSALKSLFPNGLTILSLYSGIGGTEIAIHRLGLRLKGVVSVELSETNRRILRRWWENTEQRGELVQIEDIGKLTSTKLETLIDDLGGFDLIICQNPYTPGSSKATLDLENPAGFEFPAFFEFVRVLQRVRSTMGCR
ncbi:DNA (cytosine-5)-methyltransferase DRM2 [Thalictrum thalictroides]|uniref:DNA (Cytosine-5)-methyltransferase DRM2 n=1 Tax=Thalictrum thalictroides TaxID=46969 RepID=A0A7J6VSI1_THATH|nr:DNA (cytosine-5)-methyltransferase DRM2 [Thalictrum thalictroides]